LRLVIVPVLQFMEGGCINTSSFYHDGEITMYHPHHHRLPSFFSRSKLALSVCSLLLAFLLAACGSGGTSTGTNSAYPSVSTPTQQGNQGAQTTTAPISCSRAPEAMVGQAIGIQLAPPTVASQYSTPVGDSITCIYKDAATSQTQEVVINYYSGSSASQAFNQTQKLAYQQPVSGLGDKALFDTQRCVLHVLKGNLYLYVSLVKLSEQGASKLLPEARQIATAILANA
jgi:hypothetical protein